MKGNNHVSVASRSIARCLWCHQWRRISSPSSVVYKLSLSNLSKTAPRYKLELVALYKYASSKENCRQESCCIMTHHVFPFRHSTKELCLLCHVWEEPELILPGPVCEQRPSGHPRNSSLGAPAFCNNDLGLHNPNRMRPSSWSQGNVVTRDCASWMAFWQPLHIRHAWAEHAHPQLCFGVDYSGPRWELCHGTISLPAAMSAVALSVTCWTPKETLKQINFRQKEWSTS